MKKIVKKLMISLLILTMVIPLGACGDNSKVSETTNLSKEHVYSAEDLTFDFNLEELNTVFMANNQIYMCGVHYEYDEGMEIYSESLDSNLRNEVAITEAAGETTEETETTEEVTEETEDEATDELTDEEIDEALKLASSIKEPGGGNKVQYYVSSFDLDGSNKKTINFNFGESGNINSYLADSQGNLYVILNEYFEDYSDPDNYIWEENFFFVKLNSEGEEQWRIDLKEYAKEGEEYYYVNSAVCDEKDQLIMVTTAGMLVFNTAGELISNFDLSIECNMLYLLQDNSLVVSSYGEKGEVLQKIDSTTGEVYPELYTLPTASYSNTFSRGYGADFFIANNSSVYSYNLGDEELTEILNFIDSDFEFSNLNNIIGISETELLGRYYSDTDGLSHFVKLTKVDPSQVKDKTVLTMACYYIDSNVRKSVIDFNKASDTYRITISDYSIYDTNEDYGAGVTKLNADIVSGKIPDIVILNDSLPIKSYTSKGLFEDLNPFINKDVDIKREDYLENIFEAYSTNGKLYQLVSSFSAITVAGKTADVGENAGWTLDDLNALVSTKPAGTEIFADVVRSTMLNYCIQMTNEQFINWDTGECDFDSQGFTKLLEFVKQFPEEYDYTKYEDQSYYTNYQTMYRDGRALLSIMNLGQFYDYNYMKQGTYGEDITLVGFPSENKNGSAIIANMRMAMSSKSKYKDGVWEYMRYFLLDEYQESITYGFPVSKSSLDILEQKAKEKPFYIDENGDKIEYEDSFWIDEVQIPITPCTDEDIATVNGFLSSLNQVFVYDEDLTNIIVEEAESFFSGQKSAADVAAIIQSRVQIYISENM